MALGRPVVGAATGATIELVRDGATGILFESADVTSLASAIRTYATDRPLIEAHGVAAAKALEDDILARHTFADLAPLLAKTAQRGSQPLARLPHIYRSWMEFPAVVFELLESSGSMVDPRTSRTWKLGNLALSVPRK